MVVWIENGGIVGRGVLLGLYYLLTYIFFVDFSVWHPVTNAPALDCIMFDWSTCRLSALCSSQQHFFQPFRNTPNHNLGSGKHHQVSKLATLSGWRYFFSLYGIYWCAWDTFRERFSESIRHLDYTLADFVKRRDLQQSIHHQQLA